MRVVVILVQYVVKMVQTIVKNTKESSESR
jgi:hypothetical protein